MYMHEYYGLLVLGIPHLPFVLFAFLSEKLLN